MTPRPRNGGPRQKIRICCWCDKTISKQFPVVLLTTPDGLIVGPYHAACAKQSVVATKEIFDRGLRPAIEFGRIRAAAREETLPW